MTTANNQRQKKARTSSSSRLRPPVQSRSVLRKRTLDSLAKNKQHSTSASSSSRVSRLSSQPSGADAPTSKLKPLRKIGTTERKPNLGKENNIMDNSNNNGGKGDEKSVKQLSGKKKLKNVAKQATPQKGGASSTKIRKKTPKSTNTGKKKTEVKKMVQSPEVSKVVDTAVEKKTPKSILKEKIVKMGSDGTQKSVSAKKKTPKSNRANKSGVKQSDEMAPSVIPQSLEKEQDTKQDIPKQNRTKKRLSFGGIDIMQESNKQDQNQTNKGTPSTKVKTPKKTQNIKSPKSAQKKRPIPGKFDLPRLEESEKEGSKKKSRRTSQSSPNSKKIDTKKNDEKIEMTNKMTAGKARLANEFPLNMHLSKEERKAAALEAKASKSKKDFDQLPTIISLKGDDEDDQITNDKELTTNDPKLEKSKRKVARQTKWKGRKLREQGELADDMDESNDLKNGVMYLAHIPHGFYEKEMAAYFKQFGEVTRLKLSRSKKTARSKGYAFIEFADEHVAQVAAKAMDGYLMHGQALIAKFVPSEKVHQDTFKGSNRVFKKVAWSSVERRRVIERSRNPEKLATRCGRVEKKRKQKQSQLKKQGLVYDFPEISSITA